MGDPKSCKQKLTRWMKENPEYSFDQVLEAVDLYLATEGANTTYLQNAQYFIFKQNAQREESSRLSAFIDELGNKSIIQGDWTSNIN
jgi:hypothetical protein|tara:strand:- start:7144 stop:7404 length:261 start_codon:yes stop_codon:yes gene_type:complete